MSEKTIHTESEISQIVTCPSCNQKNRLYPQVNQGIYHCGTCYRQLPDPSIPQTLHNHPTTDRKIIGLIILVGVLLTSAGLFSFVKGILLAGSPSFPIAGTPITGTPVRASPQPVVSPPSMPLQNRSLPGSKVLVPLAASGDGSLKVSNGTNRDAYVKLIDPASRKLIAAFYVKSNSDLKLEQIPDGTYVVLFTTGEDWDAKAKSFTRSSNFTKFDKSLNFVTKQLTDGRQYTIIELTLNPVPGGNATTHGVSEQDFGQY